MKKRHFTTLLSTWILAAMALTAGHAQDKTAYLQNMPKMKKPVVRDEGKPWGEIYKKKGYHNGNKIFTLFYNWGGIGDWTVNRRQSGLYPYGGDAHSYIAEFTPVIAAEVTDARGVVRHIVSDGLPDYGHADVSPLGKRWQFVPLAGYANPNQDYVAMSDNPSTWPPMWPDKDNPEEWRNPNEVPDGKDNDGNGLVDDLIFWDGQYGKKARAPQESYYRMVDYENDEFEYYPDPQDSSKRGLGLEIEVRGYQWSHPAAEDILIWTYWITNNSQYTYQKTVFGMYGDADVGDDGDQRDDDSWFDKKNDIVYQWDHDKKGVWGGPPAYFGFKYLESPGNPFDGIDNDEDGMVDESQFDGIDNDGDWNPATDDIGVDGIGPLDPGYPGPDPDGSEGNGKPDADPEVGAEPNFEWSDNDESDQIGLTSFTADPWAQLIDLRNDENVWDFFTPGRFDVPEQTVDITFLYGAGYFELKPGIPNKRKFAIAMLYGDDFDDILRNGVTMQKIYDADYSFAVPPLKPTVTIVPGDKKVTLYWDNKAEFSRDPIYGYDFEGYAIYRSSEPGFLDSWIITDSYGSRKFNKPIAQFDLIDGLKGPHPIAESGIQFNMGNDSGLAYSFVDSGQTWAGPVENGRTYYYAVVAYDKGYDVNFYERGISDIPNLQPISPDQCAKSIKMDPATGTIISFDINTGMAVPNAPAAGYVPPPEMSVDNYLIEQVSGHATGNIVIQPIDPLKVPDNIVYEISFDDSTYIPKTRSRKSFSVQSSATFQEEFVVPEDSVWINFSRNYWVPGTVTIQKDGRSDFIEGVDFRVNYLFGNLKILPSGALQPGDHCTVTYQYYPVFRSPYVHGEDFTPYFDGLRILVYDDPLQIDHEKSTWTSGDCNFKSQVSLYTNGKIVPYDYEIRFKGKIGEDISTDAMGRVTAPFEIHNVITDEPTRFVVLDKDHNSKWSAGDPIILLLGQSGFTPTFQVILTKPDSLFIDSTFVGIQYVSVDTVIGGVPTTIQVPDSVFSYDTTRVQINEPENGDVFFIHTLKPFTKDDRYRFISQAARVDEQKAQKELDKIAVVPNPYVVTAVWEPENFFLSGRGTQKIDFIHLPKKCTIKIFTLRGYLVDTIEHDSPITDGAESWDLKSKDGMRIAYGIYIYHVDAPGIGTKIGKFAIIQ